MILHLLTIKDLACVYLLLNACNLYKKWFNTYEYHLPEEIYKYFFGSRPFINKSIYDFIVVECELLIANFNHFAQYFRCI